MSLSSNLLKNISHSVGLPLAMVFQKSLDTNDTMFESNEGKQMLGLFSKGRKVRTLREIIAL